MFRRTFLKIVAIIAALNIKTIAKCIVLKEHLSICYTPQKKVEYEVIFEYWLPDFFSRHKVHNFPERYKELQNLMKITENGDLWLDKYHYFRWSTKYNVEREMYIQCIDVMIYVDEK